MLSNYHEIVSDVTCNSTSNHQLSAVLFILGMLFYIQLYDNVPLFIIHFFDIICAR